MSADIYEQTHITTTLFRYLSYVHKKGIKTLAPLSGLPPPITREKFIQKQWNGNKKKNPKNSSGKSHKTPIYETKIRERKKLTGGGGQEAKNYGRGGLVVFLTSPTWRIKTLCAVKRRFTAFGVRESSLRFLRNTFPHLRQSDNHQSLRQVARLAGDR